MPLRGNASAVELLQDDRTSARASEPFVKLLSPTEQETLAPLERFFDGWMVFSDPPYQTRLREMLHRAFSPAVVRELSERIDRRAIEATDRLATGTGDFFTEYAQPFALTVMSDVLAVAEKPAGVRVRRSTARSKAAPWT